MLGIEKLTSLIPASVLVELPTVIAKFNISNNNRLMHFLAQAAHESGNFKFVVENLNYSSEALLKIFPKYFKDKQIADKYARNAEAIGSRVYANRMGNGDEASKEGFFYRGRGYLQTTGKDNYKQFSDFIGEDCVKNPDLVATKYPLASAAFFFEKNKLWTLCDAGIEKDNIIAIRKRVNGGTIGLDDTIAKFDKFKTALA
jgi:putative chitinase